LGSGGDPRHYLTKFGRPSTHPSGAEDPTGTLCEVSPKWLKEALRMSLFVVI
jgi:hypothetical protein